MKEGRARRAQLASHDPALAERWMEAALEEARAAGERNEVPVGCIVVDAEGEARGRGRDERQGPGDPLAHAEVGAIRAAAADQGDWRLDGYTLIVTLEPCPMCAGLILLSRISRVIYGATNPKWGAAGSKTDLLGAGAFPHQPEVIGGVLAEACGDLLKQYFGKRRV